MKLWFYHENITHMHHTNLKWNKLNKFLQVFIHFRTRARGEWRYQWFRAGTGEQYVVRAIHVAVVYKALLLKFHPFIPIFPIYFSRLILVSLWLASLPLQHLIYPWGCSSVDRLYVRFCLRHAPSIINQTTDKLLTKYIICGL